MLESCWGWSIFLLIVQMEIFAHVVIINLAFAVNASRSRLLIVASKNADTKCRWDLWANFALFFTVCPENSEDRLIIISS